MWRNLIAASSIVCFSLTQLTPAFALRPTGLESSDEGRAKLTSALTTAASGLEQRTNSPDGKYVAIWIQGMNVVSIHKFDNHRLLPMGEIHADAGIRDVAFDQSGEAKLGVDLGHALIIWDVEGVRQMDRIETDDWLDPSIRGVYDRYFTTDRPWSVRPTGAPREGLLPDPLSDEAGLEGASQKTQVQIFRAAGQIVEALRSTGPVNSLTQLFPALIEEAATENIPERVSQALLAAFHSLETDSEKRHLTGFLGQAMMTGLHEFSEDFEPDPYPRTLPGHKTIWTVTTSPTIDIDAKRKLANWSDRKGVLVDPGGGGINVAIALARRGVLARPVFFYVGETGKLLIKLIENRGVFVHEGDAIELKGNEQTRVTIITSLDKAESLVPKGTPVDDEAHHQMVVRLLDPQDGVKAEDIVVISGSLAPGLPEDFYAGLGRQLVARGAIVVVDTKGAPAKAVLFSKPAAATIYSQNNLEFGELVGANPKDRKALVAKASEIINGQPPEGGMREIVITEGAGGAFSVTREKVLEIHAPKVKPVSELGAGDTSLAERVFRAWQGKGHDAGFVYGVAAGTSSVLHPGTGGGLQAEVDHFAEDLGLIEETKVKPSPPTAGLEAVLERAVDLWSQGPFSTPPEAGVTAQTVFVLKPGTHQVLPPLAEYFTVVALVRSGPEDELLRSFVTRLGLGQRVQIRPEGELGQVLAEQRGNRTILVGSEQPNWLGQLKSILQEMGVLPLGSWDAGLEAVDAYMKHQV